MNTQDQPLKGKLIAFFHQSSDMYGSDKILLYVAEGMQKSGAQVVVLLPDEGPITREFSTRGIEYHTLPMLKLTRARFSPKGLFNLALEIKPALQAYDKVFGERKVDIVHSNTLAVLGGALWSFSRKVPHLWHVHEIIEHPWVAAKLFPILLKMFADHVVCNSNATYQWLAKVLPSLTKKMTVIWNGVSTPATIDEIKVAELYKHYHPQGARLAIGLVGRINRLKGHSLLLEAAEILHIKGLNDFSVIFTGSAPSGQEHFELQLKERIAQSPIRNRVQLLGYSKDVWPSYAALDIICVPSTEPESFGLVAAEAMAIGRPVIASHSGGLIEIVQDGVTGFTFTPRDSQALAIAIEKLLNNDALRINMGKVSKSRFEAEFTLNKLTDRFLATFLKVIDTQK
ncbi:MAG TPA: glycosyltransferase family 4 protein [Methylotenera sp.]|nr:glycosyltransferase family 4 protein [Methylotenera sp.]HPH06644.1 glycosyltransferase family 4 protein [Methylotenera sp.]HPM49015.1 glycosyltransferase family 4 protein [Methylotenera sp.]